MRRASRTAAPLAAGLLLLAACGGGADPRPDVVLICVDTLRADRTSLYGYDRATTPRLDAWAERGTVFEHAWAASSWTLPSVAMLFTGQMRVGGDYGRVRPDQDYLPAMLKRAGYETSAVVANPLFHVDEGGGTSLERDFDHYLAFQRGTEGSGKNSWAADTVTDHALEWYARRGDAPVFLYVHYFDPHHPYKPDGGSKFAPRDDPARAAAFEAALLPEHREHWSAQVYAQIERELARYDTEVLQADRGIGRLLDAIDASDRADRTLVVLTSDHGEGLWQRPKPAGEAEKPEEFFPYLYYEHGVMLTSDQVHVPLVAVGPGVSAGVRRTDHVSLIDVVPTLLARAGASAQGALHGVDLFAGEVTRPEVFSICSRGTTLTLGGRWRLHEPREYRVEQHGARPELYDLLADPGEVAPVDDPGRVAAMQGVIAAWRARHETGDAADSALDADAAAALAAMGYTDQLEPEGD